MNNRHHLQAVAPPSRALGENLRQAELRAPRYTSYPTALEFTGQVGPAALLEQMDKTNQEPIPAALSLYVHLPFCAAACFYCGCNRVISRSAQRRSDYLDLIEREISVLAPHLDRDRPVVQIHFGGGTPNSYRPLELARLIRTLSSQFSIHADCEISMEVDPRQYQPGDALAWAALGINRISLGVQDVSREVQQAINRLQPREQIAELVDEARKADMHGINFDLIYGLPRQTLAGVDDNVDLVALLQPDRIAVFHYAHLPQRFPAQRVIDESELPGLATRLAMQARYSELLTQLGYRHIGMDHFSHPDDSLARALAQGTLQRNFQGYSTAAGSDIIGLGVSAISSVGRLYAQNHSDITAYRRALENKQLATQRGWHRSDDDLQRHAIIQQVMCQQRIDFNAFGGARAFHTRYAKALGQLRQLDPSGQLVRIETEALYILPAGRNVLRLIARCFDRYAARRNTQQLARAV
ncbi:MAG: oxygen-independent coproporphyrinogen III oxidase [Oceanococcus sp.]|nr:MAG: oxygen-independent coproporphyrinogen III oxidase [Oceanococcus sp.]